MLHIFNYVNNITYVNLRKSEQNSMNKLCLVLVYLRFELASSGITESVCVALIMCVSDEVEDPVLAVNSSWSSPDPCSFTCEGSNIVISSIYNDSSCSQEEGTSADNHSLILSCSGDSIMCNYSNPVSLKTQVKKVNELCTVKQGTFFIRSEL